MGDSLTRVYRKGLLEAEGFPVGELSEYLEQPDTFVWADLCTPSKQQLEEISFELHELAVEDSLEVHQRPKLDRYESHSFLVCYAVAMDQEHGVLDEFEIDAFFNERYLITVRKNEGFRMEPVLERWDRSPDLAVEGVSFLLYGLLDVVVDDYFDAIEAFDDYYDQVSEGLFSEERPLDPTEQRHWFEMRRALVHFRKLAVPMREAVSGLMRRERSVVPEEMYPYFQDVYDHILRVTESTDSLRDLVSTIVETNLNLRDYRQNLIVKKVSSWAAIVAVPALITGYYGMNVPYPGSGETWGAVASTAFIFLACFALYRLFRSRDWL